jgi:hypothetical protein
VKTGSKVRVKADHSGRVKIGSCGMIIDSGWQGLAPSRSTVSFQTQIHVGQSSYHMPTFTFTKDELEEISDDEYETYLLLNG